jgi:fatty acid desaturase
MNTVVAPTPPTPVDPDDHAPTHWVSRAAFPLVIGCQLATQAALGFAVFHGHWWLAVPLALLVSHFMHGALIGFHEASHGNLRKNRLLNEIDGQLIGVLSFLSFTLYRAAHQTHHMYLATERDEEMWPFTNTQSPRWVRCTAAFFELNFGLLFTPFLFWRMFLRRDSVIRSRRIRRKIWWELALILGSWTLILAGVAWFNLWTYYVWLYLVPAFLAGNAQSWRKYIEHIGLHGHTAKSATRSIIANTWSGRLLSLTLLHEPYHAVHHMRAGLPHHELPHHAGALQPSEEGELTPFPSYAAAIRHLLGELSDPRVGSHWPERTARPA